jgi:hypothetical protein
MKKLKTGVTTTEVNGKIEVNSPYFKDYNNREESYKQSAKVTLYSLLILACIVIGLNIIKLF